jgi:hypothetical protein
MNIKWLKYRSVQVLLALGALASLAMASGAAKWY